MAKTDLKLYSKAQGTEKKITTSLPYINPDANSTTLKQFAVKLNNFTTNTYDETDRVQTINVDTEEVPVTPPEKADTTLTINDTSGNEITDFNPIRINLTYKDVNFRVITNNTTGTCSFINHPIDGANLNYIGAAYFDNGSSSPGNTIATAFCQNTPTANQSLGTIEVIIAESDTHKAARKTIPVKAATS